MNILSFSRMKSFHKDGRVRTILKLRLPRLDNAHEEYSEFNSFYERLAEEYIRLAEELPYSAEIGSRPTTVSVDFTVIHTDEHIGKSPKKRQKTAIVIKRKTRINAKGETRCVEQTDIYDKIAFIFVK